MGADKAPEDGSEGFGAYLQAKFEADEAVRASGLDYTIVRPGGLTDDPGTGLVSVAEHLDRGQIPRADVAAVFAACLDEPATIGKSFDLISGDTPIAAALPRSEPAEPRDVPARGVATAAPDLGRDQVERDALVAGPDRPLEQALGAEPFAAWAQPKFEAQAEVGKRRG